ncbi:MAG: transporter [Sandaracinaceae bacterium]|nr:transporter [Sandaracinaceae bacterium]
MLVRGLVTLLVLGALSAPAAAQDLGHRVLGTLGSRAGEQRDAGLYVADRLVYYGASTIRDRAGQPLAVEGFRAEALGNAFGLAATFEIPELATYVSFAAAAPLARVSLRADRPEASLDRFGLGDVYLMPAGLGWRVPHLDVVATYGIYVPTGLFRLGEGNLGSGHVTHQLGAGAAVFFDDERRFRVSALASFDLNHRKVGVDIVRGETVQVQGGAGALLFDLVDVGVIGAALWQVGDDSGADIPPALLGARDRVVGVGAEISVIVAPISGRVGMRYLWETAAQSRPEGHVLVFELAILAWSPARE